MYVILLRNKNAGQQGVVFVKYEIGDFVSKPVIGICKIENILYLNPQDEKNDKLYYLMKPVFLLLKYNICNEKVCSLSA